ncbi:hypothetical protein BH23PLA1_BH23PLA1_09880 [soil metagenome]
MLEEGRLFTMRLDWHVEPDILRVPVPANNHGDRCSTEEGMDVKFQVVNDDEGGDPTRPDGRESGASARLL